MATRTVRALGVVLFTGALAVTGCSATTGTGPPADEPNYVGSVSLPVEVLDEAHLLEESDTAVIVRAKSSRIESIDGFEYTVTTVDVEEPAKAEWDVWQSGTPKRAYEHLEDFLREGESYLIFAQHIEWEPGNPSERDVKVTHSQGLWHVVDGSYARAFDSENLPERLSATQVAQLVSDKEASTEAQR